MELACKTANVPFQSQTLLPSQFVNIGAEHAIAASSEKLHKDVHFWETTLKSFDVVYFCFSLINRPSCNQIMKVNFVVIGVKICEENGRDRDDEYDESIGWYTSRYTRLVQYWKSENIKNTDIEM